MINKFLLPDGIELEAFLGTLRSLSWGAADILRCYARNEQPPFGFNKTLTVEEGGEGPVSAADLAVNQWLINGLKLNFPSADWQVISEETVKDQYQDQFVSDSEWTWILDPLDGTKDFLTGSKDYAVHLALMHNKKPFMGIVIIPEREELWFGIIGYGAWCEDKVGKRKDDFFSYRKDIPQLILVSSRSHRDQRLERLVHKLNFAETKSVGSVGCKIATILRGESDVYISLSGTSAPKDWDMAGPEALIKAAGGVFTHSDGSPLKYFGRHYEQRGCLIASHGNTHDQLCDEISFILSTIDPDYIV